MGTAVATVKPTVIVLLFILLLPTLSCSAVMAIAIPAVSWPPIATVAVVVPKAMSVDVHNFPADAAVGGPRVTLKVGKIMVDAPAARMAADVVQVTKSLSLAVLYAFVSAHLALVVAVPVNVRSWVSSTAEK